MLQRLSVQRFRNLPDVTWEVGPGAHLVLGRNGAGKTSLLEAVYLAATARSFRTSQLEDCVRRATGSVEPVDAFDDAGAQRGESANLDAARAAGRGFTVHAAIAGAPGGDLAVSLTEAGLERSLDGKAVTLPVYLGVLPCVIWTGREEEILAGVPERRRRMIDAGLVAERPERVSHLARHRQVLAQKRELLRRRQGGLDAWNRLLAEAGSTLQRVRADWVARLAGHLTAVLTASERGLPPVVLRYEPSPASGPEGPEAFYQELAAVADDELRLGRPCIGAHLDRLSILWGGESAGTRSELDVSRVASAGERKALGLLLVAAQAELLEAAGRAPTLLLDDVDAELDLAALGAVWRVLAAGRQVLASSSRDEVRERLTDVTTWRLEGGPTGPGPVRG